MLQQTLPDRIHRQGSVCIRHLGEAAVNPGSILPFRKYCQREINKALSRIGKQVVLELHQVFRQLIQLWLGGFEISLHIG